MAVYIVLYMRQILRTPRLDSPEIILWLLRGTLAGIAIGALQLLLSMLIRSFSLPIGIALVGSFLGLLINNMGKGICWPYSLMLIGMNSNKNIDMLAGESGSLY